MADHLPGAKHSLFDFATMDDLTADQEVAASEQVNRTHTSLRYAPSLPFAPQCTAQPALSCKLNDPDGRRLDIARIVRGWYNRL